MIDHDANFDEAAREVAALNNIPFETALHYLWRVGDTPELDKSGRVVVYDETGGEIARIILPTDDE